MWIDQQGKEVKSTEWYVAPDDTKYPPNFPRGQIPGLTEVADPPPPAPTVEEVQAQVVRQTQTRLDAFAQTRGYDGILSASTYVGDPSPRLAAEGVYAKAARSATWETLYAFMAEVQAGTQPMPTGFADVEPLLPVLQWP